VSIPDQRKQGEGAIGVPEVHEAIKRIMEGAELPSACGERSMASEAAALQRLA
jgi:hypothetical protein